MDLLSMLTRKTKMPEEGSALPGRLEPIATSTHHAVNGNALKGPFPKGLDVIYFGLGCFWGAERIFWQTPGVWVTAVGYQAGHTPNPTYQEVCTGLTGHNEVVMVVFDPNEVSVEALCRLFFESHDPTQGMRQGNDIGTQYRSGIYTTTDQQDLAAQQTKADYQTALATSRYGTITTEILPAPEFYYAEDYHQQYLHKNPGGYCGLGGTGVSCPRPNQAV